MGDRDRIQTKLEGLSMEEHRKESEVEHERSNTDSEADSDESHSNSDGSYERYLSSRSKRRLDEVSIFHVKDILQLVLTSVHFVVENIKKKDEEITDEAFQNELKTEYEAASFGRTFENILNSQGWITEDVTHVVNVQQAKLFFLGVSREIKRGEFNSQKNVKKKIYIIASSAMDSLRCDSFHLLDNFVNCLKEIAPKKPDFIIVILRNCERANLDDRHIILNSSDEEFSEIIKRMHKLTNEIENFRIPLVGVSDDSIVDMNLNVFLACHYRLVVDYTEIPNVRFKISTEWITCFLIGGILRRISCLASPMLAFNWLEKIGTSTITSDELRILGIIDDHYTLPKNERELKSFMYKSLDRLLALEFKKIKEKKKQIAKERFFALKNKDIWNAQLEKLIIANPYFAIFLTKSVNYLKDIADSGDKLNVDRDIKVAIELRNAIDIKAILDFFRGEALLAREMQKITKLRQCTIGCIGYNIAEHTLIRLLLELGHTIISISNERNVAVFRDLLRNTEITNDSMMMIYNGSLEPLKNVDIVIIAGLVGEYQDINVMIQKLEDVVRADVPICLGFFGQDLTSIQNSAKHPESILGLHLWGIGLYPTYLNFIVNNESLNVSPYLSKIYLAVGCQLFCCVSLSNKEENGAFVVIRTLLSILSELSFQLVNGCIKDLCIISVRLRNAKIFQNVFKMALSIGFRNLLNYAKMFENFNQKFGLKWNLILIEKLAEEYESIVSREDNRTTFLDNIQPHISYEEALFNVVQKYASRRRKIDVTDETLSVRLKLSYLIEPIRWYKENNLENSNKDLLYIMNNFLGRLYCLEGAVCIGPFRFVDEFLSKYESIIKSSDYYYPFMWERLDPNGPKFFP